MEGAVLIKILGTSHVSSISNIPCTVVITHANQTQTCMPEHGRYHSAIIWNQQSPNKDSKITFRVSQGTYPVGEGEAPLSTFKSSPGQKCLHIVPIYGEDKVADLLIETKYKATNNSPLDTPSSSRSRNLVLS